MKPATGDLNADVVLSLARRLRISGSAADCNALIDEIFKPAPKEKVVLTASERNCLETELAHQRDYISRLRPNAPSIGTVHQKIKELRDLLYE